MRIASLLPSATEIALALGLRDDLVAVTFECDLPSDLRERVDVVVGGRDTTTMTPFEIDQYVRTQAASGGDLYTLDRGTFARLDPDLILTQDLCRVCAIPAGRVRDALDHLGCGAEVATLDPHSLDDILATILAVGRQAGVADRAAALTGSLRARLDAVAAAVAGSFRPRVVVIEWIDPVFGAGHWIPDLVSAAGGAPVAAKPHAPSEETTWLAIAASNPEMVVVSPCGYGLAGAVEQAHEVLDQVPGIPVWAIDADGLVVRPGPRVVDGVEALASVLHPGLVPPAPPGCVACIRA